MIDSEKFNYQPKYGTTKEVYGYWINSNKILKKHLNNKIPKVIMTFYEIGAYKNDQGIINKKSGAISLNLSGNLLSCFQKNDMSKKW